MIKLIDLLNEVNSQAGPCLYPGAFRPPHKGHFEAAQWLASQTYITKVYVIISPKDRGDITADDSLYVWREYLKNDPNPKIEVELSQEDSPVEDVYRYMSVNSQADPVYAAAGQDDIASGMFKSIQQTFSGRLKILQIPTMSAGISSTDMRLDIESGDYDAFVKLIPTATVNKGGATKIFNRLLKSNK